MIEFFANLFGYLLNFLYNLVQNYGLAIILFSIIIKLIMLPLTIKQQKTMKQSVKLQEKMKTLQVKYKNNPEKLNQEMMELYKSENMSPFSGCFSSIAQIILLFAVFYLVRSPLTHMRKVDSNIIAEYTTQIQESEEEKTAYTEIQIIREKGNEDPNVYVNMEFLGLDLSKVPGSNFEDFRVYIIPALYVISSIISIKLTNNTQGTKKDDEKKDSEDPMLQTNKMMNWMMPIMSVSIAIIAPLGLALYWLVNNILMIIERLILNKFMNKGEE